jgi:hypothetical protein
VHKRRLGLGKAYSPWKLGASASLNSTQDVVEIDGFLPSDIMALIPAKRLAAL